MSTKPPELDPAVLHILAKTIKARTLGNIRARRVGTILLLLLQGYTARFAQAKRIPRVRAQGHVNGYHTLPFRWRWLHRTTNRPHPGGLTVPRKDLSSLQAAGVVSKEAEDYVLTPHGEQVAIQWREFGVFSQQAVADPLGMGKGKEEIPHPYAQPGCPQRRTPKGRWAKGWVAACQGLPKEQPYKIRSKDWERGYEAGMRYRMGG